MIIAKQQISDAKPFYDAFSAQQRGRRGKSRPIECGERGQLGGDCRDYPESAGYYRHFLWVSLVITALAFATANAQQPVSPHFFTFSRDQALGIHNSMVTAYVLTQVCGKIDKENIEKVKTFNRSLTLQFGELSDTAAVNAVVQRTTTFVHSKGCADPSIQREIKAMRDFLNSTEFKKVERSLSEFDLASAQPTALAPVPKAPSDSETKAEELRRKQDSLVANIKNNRPPDGYGALVMETQSSLLCRFGDVDHDPNDPNGFIGSLMWQLADMYVDYMKKSDSLTIKAPRLTEFHQIFSEKESSGCLVFVGNGASMKAIISVLEEQNIRFKVGQKWMTAEEMTQQGQKDQAENFAAANQRFENSHDRAMSRASAAYMQILVKNPMKDAGSPSDLCKGQIDMATRYDIDIAHQTNLTGPDRPHQWGSAANYCENTLKSVH